MKIHLLEKIEGERINEHDDEKKVINVAAAVCAMARGLICAATTYYYNYIDKGPYENMYYTTRQFVKKVSESDEHCKSLLRMNVARFEKFVDLFVL